MVFLFDADALITPNNTWYSIEYCPAYWELLLRANTEGNAISIEKVYEEVTAQDDQVAEWAKRNKYFFIRLDSETLEMNKIVTDYVNRLPPPIDGTAKRDFFKGADTLLISYAIEHKCTLVTCEKEVDKACKTVKIPNVCKHFNVRSMHPMQFVRELQAHFILADDREERS